MEKIINPGAVLIGQKHAQVYCHIRFNDGRLSITGVEGPLPSGNCRGACGQIVMHLKPADLRLSKDWTRPMLSRFLKAWDTYHLNDMQAACEHQRALGWTWATHPEAPCLTCGYKLGTEWKRMEVPADVIAFLSSLPDSKTKPAWC